MVKGEAREAPLTAAIVPPPGSAAFSAAAVPVPFLLAPLAGLPPVGLPADFLLPFHPTGVPRAHDMEELKALVNDAKPGTGEIARVLANAAFTPRHAGFTSLMQMVAKAKQPEKALELFGAMQASAR